MDTTGLSVVIWLRSGYPVFTGVYYHPVLAVIDCTRNRGASSGVRADGLREVVLRSGDILVFGGQRYEAAATHTVTSFT